MNSVPSVSNVDENRRNMNIEKKTFTLIKQGSEAKIYSGTFHGKPCILKERFPKKYRHPDLDREITTSRLKQEVRSLMRCRLTGIHAPTIYFVNTELNYILMENIIDGVTAKEYIMATKCNDSLVSMASTIGKTVGQLHSQNIIHGDLTTSNMLIRNSDVSKITMIDFGLSFIDHSAEDKGVDLYVLERAMLSTHPDSEHLFEVILKSYSKANKKDAKETLKKLDDIRLRGRKRTMVG